MYIHIHNYICQLNGANTGGFFVKLFNTNSMETVKAVRNISLLSYLVFGYKSARKDLKQNVWNAIHCVMLFI